MKLKYLGILFFTLFLINVAHANTATDETLADPESFCNYFTEKSKAKITTLLFPDAIARLDNEHYDTNSQKNLIVGLSKDLSDLNKANYTRRLIQEECMYYRLDQAAQLQVRYAIRSVKFEATKFKLEQIQIAKNKIRKILLSIKQRINSKNDTLRTYENIKSSLMKLEDAENEIDMELASQQFPKIKYTNLTVLLKNLAIAREKRQKTLDQLEKQNNWSLQLMGGAQRDFSNPVNKKMQPYVALVARYNLGSVLSDYHMDNSLSEHAHWQENQVIGTQDQLAKLILSISLLKAATEERLSQLTQNYAYYSTLSHKLTVTDSTKAVHFRQEVEVNKMTLKIEMDYAQRTIELLRAIV